MWAVEDVWNLSRSVRVVRVAKQGIQTVLILHAVMR